MFGIIKEIFSVLLTGIVSACNHRKCFSLSNHKRMTQPTLIDLYPNEYTQKSHYYPFVVKLDVLEALITFMTYVIKYVFQIKEKI